VAVLGLIFLRYADHRFAVAEKELAGKGTGRRAVGKEDYQAKCIMYLAPQARLSKLLARPGRKISRLATPSFLLMALICFPLPWVELRCNNGAMPQNGMTLGKQSGFQAVYGGRSTNAAVETMNNELIKEEEKRIGKEALARRIANAERQHDDDRVSAPWLSAYPCVLLLGIAFGLNPIAKVRRFNVGICCLTAFALVVIQMQMGLPIEQEFGKTLAQEAIRSQSDRYSSAASALLVETHHTPWFWVALLAPLASLLLAIGEPTLVGFAQKRPAT
jgi:hypothetical protein